MKLRDTFRQISGIANSSLLASYLDGVKVSLPGVGEVTITAHKPSRSIRPRGLTFNTFSYFTEVTGSNGITAVGFGEDDLALLALQKSIAEGVERVVYRSLKAINPTLRSSNGWAAHVSPARSERAALLELLERDAVLLHWLTSTPMLEVPSTELPSPIATWAKDSLSRADRFRNLRVLISTLGHIPTATAVLSDQDGYAVLSHSSGETVREAIAKALSEACRIGHIASGAARPNDSFELPQDHALVYAFGMPLPSFIFGTKVLSSDAEQLWKAKRLRFERAPPPVNFDTMKCGSLYVSRAHSNDVQDLFFGETDTALKKGWINAGRITEVCGGIGLNPLPHFVP